MKSLARRILEATKTYTLTYRITKGDKEITARRCPEKDNVYWEFSEENKPIEKLERNKGKEKLNKLEKENWKFEVVDNKSVKV